MCGFVGSNLTPSQNSRSIFRRSEDKQKRQKFKKKKRIPQNIYKKKSGPSVRLLTDSMRLEFNTVNMESAKTQRNCSENDTEKPKVLVILY